MIPLGAAFGVPLKMHAAFPVLMASVLWLGQGGLLAASLLALLLHEAAHTLAARALGQRFESIELMPFGGVARMESSLSLRPAQEMIIVLSGPVVSLLLSLLTGVSGLTGPFVRNFLRFNLILASVNLLPALPLDGGRALRAACTHRLGRARATRIFSFVGMVFGGLIVLLGVWSAVRGIVNPALFLLGAYLIYAAQKEKETLAAAYLTAMHGRAARLHREGALPVRFLAVENGTPPERLAARLTAGTYHLFVLVDDNMRRVGTMDEGEALSRALAARLGPGGQ